jgi:hypothetical protein
VQSTNASGDFSKGVDFVVAQEIEVLENPRGLCGYATNRGYYHQSPFENDRERIRVVMPDKDRLVSVLLGSNFRLRTNHGEGEVTEIDEGKFGKRKYDLGQHVRSQMVVGVIIKESGRVFLFVVHHELRKFS